MIVRDIRSLARMDQVVECPKRAFTSFRFLLERDGLGYTITKTVIPKGGPHTWHYKNHLESCYCVSGKGILKDVNSGKSYDIEPDVLYSLDKNDLHTFEALEDIVLICVFNPPLTGKEVHKDDHSYE